MMQNQDTYSIEAEVELLGMLIQDNTRFDNIDFFRGEYFYLQLHGKIFDAICNLINKNQIADIINIYHILEKENDFTEFGAKTYLLKIQQTLSYSTIRGRAELLYSLFLKRRLIQTGQEIIDNANKSNFMDIVDIVSTAEEKIYSLNSKENNLQISNTKNVIDDVLNEFYEAIFNPYHQIGIKTGFRDIDNLICSFKKGDFIVLGATTSAGKTSFALSLAYNMAKNDVGVLFCSLEMTDKQLMKRMVSMHTGANAKSLETGRYFSENRLVKYRQDEYEMIKEKAQEINNLPFYIQDAKNGLTLGNIRSIGRKMKKKEISIIFVDYIQLIKSTNNDKNKTDAGRMSEIAHGLKALAKELNVVIVALSQLSRSVDAREDHKPILSDLKESGAIAEAADLIMLLYREAYYLERKKPEYIDKIKPRTANDNQKEYATYQQDYATKREKYNEWKVKFDAVKNKAELNIAKNRNGEIGSVELFFDSSKTKFDNIANIVIDVDANIVIDVDSNVVQIDRVDWDEK